jgi:hypothetical protein
VILLLKLRGYLIMSTPRLTYSIKYYKRYKKL